MMGEQIVEAPMKTEGLLNSDLIAVIARIGHGDMVVITDRGFPFPIHSLTKTLDLSVVRNIPRFLDVVKPVVEESEFESVVLAEEIKTENTETHQNLIDIIKKQEKNEKEISIKYIPHDEFKDLVLHGAERGDPVVCMIKTGEFSPYANIILTSGVPFSKASNCR